MLIDAKAVLNVQTTDGSTPLSMAKDNGNQEMIELIERAMRGDELSDPINNLVDTSIELGSVGEQAVTALAMLEDEVVVRVKDQNGDYFEGALVKFTVLEGSVTNPTAISDYYGKATNQTTEMQAA